MQRISGFSKLTKTEKLQWLTSQLDKGQQHLLEQLPAFWHPDAKVQKLLDEFSENTISNFYLPYGLAPNFLINEKNFVVPMAIEESSVVAAASKAAKFWSQHGGIKAEVISTTKVGHVHMTWAQDAVILLEFFEQVKEDLLVAIAPIAANMNKRGGGVLDLKLLDETTKLKNYYKLEVRFETCDAMGANFINSILEELAKKFKALMLDRSPQLASDLDIIMAILSNYTPECIVKVFVECQVEELARLSSLTGSEFAKRFKQAVDIARVDVSRAVTHNKGIFNGIDAVVLATGNDFRAIEAAGHAYAARDGQYRSLSLCELSEETFRFEMTLPLALGTVGGLTSLHPMAKASFAILGQISAAQLMQICASVGLMQNFGAVHSLVTTGIQKGHMKMHLLNILAQLKASKEEILAAKIHFEDKTVSFGLVRDFLNQSRLIH